ncbi:hypothetical protein [Actinokineospora sp. NBRC 105648]|uniref:hypothetical protein n=1 Tax=Actinokineospora sp. NBRC 105648 TaxID=3032206 RepID=UPI00255259AB|nr:hypothetical protein [Actinokineospora sp. NBRC 105648]
MAVVELLRLAALAGHHLAVHSLPVPSGMGVSLIGGRADRVEIGVSVTPLSAMAAALMAWHETLVGASAMLLGETESDGPRVEIHGEFGGGTPVRVVAYPDEGDLVGLRDVIWMGPRVLAWLRAAAG